MVASMISDILGAAALAVLFLATLYIIHGLGV
jgi:hypothetical protein